MSSDRSISYEELSQHSNAESLWMAISGTVYDVTKFVEEHPGGEESLLDVAGKDATGPFNDAGHSDDARELLDDFKIGVLTGEDTVSSNRSKGTEQGSALSWLIPLGIALAAAFVYRFVIAKPGRDA